MKKKWKINIRNDSHAIPFSKVLEAVKYMAYGSIERVMFEMLFLTGCRIEELSSMKLSGMCEDMIFWKTGKNQTGFRKEQLPDYYLAELEHYRQHNKVYSDHIFGISSDTFRRYFNKKIRPNLSPEWQEKTFYEKVGILQLEYVFQLKGLRKDYQTLEFAKQLKKWRDSGVALEFTSKKMKHSSTRITAYHYIENFESLEIGKYAHLTPQDILKTRGSQRSLLEFFERDTLPILTPPQCTALRLLGKAIATTTLL